MKNQFYSIVPNHMHKNVYLLIRRTEYHMLEIINLSKTYKGGKKQSRISR